MISFKLLSLLILAVAAHSPDTASLLDNRELLSK